MKLLFVFFTALLALPKGVLANPPLKVVYSHTETTQFKWQWPYQAARTTTYVQTKPYFYTGHLLNVSREDLAKYRFHYSQNTYKNPWGYYFPKGTKLGNTAILGFDPTRFNDRVYVVKPAK